MRSLIFAFLILALAPTTPLLSQELATPASKAVDAGFPFEEYVETSKAEFEKSFISSIEQQNAPISKLFAERPDARKAAISAGTAEYGKQYRLITIPAIKSAIAAIYTRTFTTAELEQIFEHHLKWGGAPDEAYNKTPLGQKEIGLSSQVANAILTTSQASLPDFMPSVIAKMQSAIQTALTKSGPTK